MYYHDSFYKTYSLSEIQFGLEGLGILDLLKLCLDTSSCHDLQVRLEHPDLPDPKAAGDAWVITQYQVDLKRQIEGDGDLEVMTQVVDLNRFFVTRQFTVSYQGNHVLEAKVQFALLDLVKRKMKQINLLGFEPKEQVSAKFKAFQTFQHALEIRLPLKIQNQDIDENHHVNNLVYIKWALDGAVNQLDLTLDLDSIGVKYGAEVLPNHEVELVLLKEEANPHVLQAKIINKTLKKDACKIQIEMRN